MQGGGGRTGRRRLANEGNRDTAGATARRRDRRDNEAQAEIAVAAQISRSERASMFRRLRKSEANRTSLSRRLRNIRWNERSSGSLCSAAARNPESARAGISPAEAGERDPR